MLLAFTDYTGIHTVTRAKTPSLGLRSWGKAHSQHQFLHPRRSMHTSPPLKCNWNHVASPSHVPRQRLFSLCHPHYFKTPGWEVSLNSPSMVPQGENPPVMVLQGDFMPYVPKPTKYLAILFFSVTKLTCPVFLDFICKHHIAPYASAPRPWYAWVHRYGNSLDKPPLVSPGKLALNLEASAVFSSGSLPLFSSQFPP